MDLLPSEEQNQIVAACVQFLTNELPVERLHTINEENPSITKTSLRKMAELGWFGLGLAEESGGVGYSLKEEALLFVELGRYLVSPTVLGSVLGARVATAAGKADLAASIIAGDIMVAPAIFVNKSAADTCTAQIGEQVSACFYIFDGINADFVLLFDKSGVALVDKKNISTREKIVCMDEKVSMELAEINTATSIYIPSKQENIYLRGVLLTAAMQLGIAEAARDRSVEYAKLREQYGKPIGSFQAIKHSCAEMAVRCESVKSLLYHAAIVLNDPKGSYGENFEFDTVAAKLLATHAAQKNANEAVQVHGGMGFTQEMDIHLFVKRAYVLDQLFGSQRNQSSRLVQLAGPVL